MQAYADTPVNILRKGDQQSRDRLSDTITSKNKIMIHRHFTKDNRTVYKEMPQKIKVLIVPKRFKHTVVSLTKLLKLILVSSAFCWARGDYP